MKVIVTGLRGLPGVMGGVESHCEELLPRLHALRPDFDITVIGRSPYVGSKAYSYRDIRVRPLPAPRSPSSEAIVSTALGVLYAWLKGADLLHIHAIGPGMMTPVARLLGLPVVVTYHSRNYEHGKWSRFARFMLRRGEALSMSFADKIIVVAPWLLDALARAYPQHASKLICIPNGVPEMPPDEDRPQAIDGLGTGYILAVGRIVPEKGFDYLVDAVLRAKPARKLAIVGDADHESEYARSLMRRANDQIRFVGRQPRTALKRIYENAALFVLPSFHEGLPISALEAASCGIPMILSDIPANRDLGLPDRNYFPAGDEAELRKRLNEEPARFETDYRQLTSRFDWDSSASATAEIYRAVAKRRRPNNRS
ncbi:MAG TPA: glycosyltransferase family 4 protein [Allosphingosinicella sp.]|nr:glycosyltransferase family 4 protein [Allosphingosinicella sp.]